MTVRLESHRCIHCGKPIYRTVAARDEPDTRFEWVVWVHRSTGEIWCQRPTVATPESAVIHR